MDASGPVVNHPWVCIECGGRQAERGPCTACRESETLDAREERVRELMYDVNLRLAAKAETRARLVGVAVGIGAIVGAWLIPGYWDLRGTLYPGIPFLVDQWVFMALIGVVVSKLLEKRLLRPRFPYLDMATLQLAS